MMSAFFAAALALQAAVPQPKFDSGRAWEHLRQLVAIGPRPRWGSSTNTSAM